MLERSASPRACVGFEVGGVHYAFDIGRVREILRPLSLQALPHAPAVVSGVVDHRGEIVPVVDLRLHFGVGTGAPAPRWIIVSSADRLVGVVVDRMTEVFEVADTELRELPSLGQDARAASEIVAAYAYENSLIFLLEVDRIARLAEDASSRVPIMRGAVSK